MRRYFFDLVGQGRCLYDFHGRQFPDPAAAREAAQLIALNVEIEEFASGRVDVRDARGGEVFFIVIRVAEQCAA